MTKPTKTYKPLSIIVVPFPFTDKEKTKRRPALVLSNEIHQDETGHITLAMITSAKNSLWPNDHQITSMKDTGLYSPSVVRQKIFTIDARLIIECIGHLTGADKKKVGALLEQHLSLS